MIERQEARSKGKRQDARDKEHGTRSKGQGAKGKRREARSKQEDKTKEERQEDREDDKDTFLTRGARAARFYVVAIAREQVENVT